MFAGRFSSSTGVIGIDFGACGVKVIQLRDKADRVHVVGAARLDVPLLPAAPLRPPTGPAGHAPGPAMPNGSSVAQPTAADLLANQLRAALSAGGLSGRRCVVSLARSDVSVQSIRLPKMPDDELRQTARWEASQRFNLDRQAMEADFIRTGAVVQGGETREEVMIIAASHAAIHARLEPVLAAGLRPLAVDTTFTGLARMFGRRARRHSDRDTAKAVVEIGYSGATLLIMRGDQIAFCKPIQIGGKDFNEAVAEHLQLDLGAATELRIARIARHSAALKLQHSERPCTDVDSPEGVQRESKSSAHVDVAASFDSATDRAVYEAVRPLMGELVKEVMLCLRYYNVTFRGHPPEHIILTGGDGLEPKLGQTMATACKTQVMYDDLGATLSSIAGPLRACLNRTPGPAACWAVAAGLSLRGIRRSAGSRAPEVDGIGSAPVINPERTAGAAVLNTSGRGVAA